MSRTSLLITAVAVVAAGYGAWRYYGQPDLMALARGQVRPAVHG